MDESRGNRRYVVTFEFSNGSRDVLTAWATDAGSAAQAARNWLEFSQDYPAGEASKLDIDLLGNESDQGDLGIAEMNDEVNHRRFSPEGDPCADGLSRRAGRGAAIDEFPPDERRR